MTPRYPEIALIAAVAANGAIGRGGDLPWRIPEDLARFRRLTLGRPVVIGRKTFESLGRPLPGRSNHVATRDPGRLDAPGARVHAGIDAALAAARADAAASGADAVYVIGGGEVYRATLPLAARLELTQVDLDVDGDAFFPPFDARDWIETARTDRPATSDRPALVFRTLIRRGADPS